MPARSLLMKVVPTAAHSWACMGAALTTMLNTSLTVPPLLSSAITFTGHRVAPHRVEAIGRARFRSDPPCRCVEAQPCRQRRVVTLPSPCSSAYRRCPYPLNVFVGNWYRCPHPCSPPSLSAILRVIVVSATVGVALVGVGGAPNGIAVDDELSGAGRPLPTTMNPFDIDS